MLYALGKWPEAGAHLETLAASDSLNVEYLGMRGLLRARMGDRIAALHVEGLLAATKSQPASAKSRQSLFRANSSSYG